MRVHLVFIIYLLTTIAAAQAEEAKVIPRVTSLPRAHGRPASPWPPFFYFPETGDDNARGATRTAAPLLKSLLYRDDDRSCGRRLSKHGVAPTTRRHCPLGRNAF
jgi:hypothetical protein